jgi:hypothetical protein
VKVVRVMSFNASAYETEEEEAGLRLTGAGRWEGIEDMPRGEEGKEEDKKGERKKGERKKGERKKGERKKGEHKFGRWCGNLFIYHPHLRGGLRDCLRYPDPNDLPTRNPNPECSAAAEVGKSADAREEGGWVGRLRSEGQAGLEAGLEEWGVGGGERGGEFVGHVYRPCRYCEGRVRNVFNIMGGPWVFDQSDLKGARLVNSKP